MKEHASPFVDQVLTPEMKAREQDKPILPPIAKPSHHRGLLISPVPARLDFSRPADKPEPTIQVTIGRIEVRAVKQTAAKRPKPKGPAPMSLDDYLKRRNGGG